MKLKLNGCEMDFAPGARWLDLLDVLPEGEKGLAPLGVCLQGRTLSLNEEAISGADARVLTYADEEGRRIYERSLQFLFLAALRREAPQARARIEHSFGQGLYIDISGVSASPALSICVFWNAQSTRAGLPSLPLGAFAYTCTTSLP